MLRRRKQETYEYLETKTIDETIGINYFTEQYEGKSTTEGAAEIGKTQNTKITSERTAETAKPAEYLKSTSNKQKGLIVMANYTNLYLLHKPYQKVRNEVYLYLYSRRETH